MKMSIQRPLPSMDMRMPARAEVFLSDGRRQNDVFGYTQVQLIRDVLGHYERHRQWMHHLNTQSPSGQF